MSDFQPKLLGFLCNWCAYAGADLAGVSRFQYPANMRVIRVMCSGRVDPLLVLKPFREGIDGVAVLGCHPGDCHYQTGNYEAERKMHMVHQVLTRIGIEPERLYLDWVSAAEGKRFSEVVTKFTEQVRELGPISKHKDISETITLGERIVESVRIRWLVGKQRELVEKGNVYHEKVNDQQITDLLWDNINKEYDRQRIFTLLKRQSESAVTIAKTLQIPSDRVVKYLTNMENRGLIHLTDISKDVPYYTLSPAGGDSL